MRILAVDLGNTRIKWGIFEKGLLVNTGAGTGDAALENLKMLVEEQAIDRVVLSATGNSKDFVTFLKKNGLSVELVSSKTPVPYKILYQTPATLGVDRLVLMAAASREYAGIATLVIDAGTCITYDFKDVEDRYLGGAISPGIQMRFKAMHEFTARLPQLEVSDTPVDLIGKSTYESMQSGVIHGVVAEIDGLIDLYKERYDGLRIILTGGDALFLSGSLKNGIFADLNFLLKGLYYIVEFNTTS